MRLRSDMLYVADKGKHFVLTEKGKAESASFRDKTVGEPVSEYDTEAVRWSVEKGYQIEVDIPDWITKEGFTVMYDYNGSTLFAGNPIIFPERELAEKYLRHYQAYSWMDHTLYIRPAIYEGRALKKRRNYAGKLVYNMSWYYGTDCLDIGDLVEKEIIEDIVNCLLPACMRSDCTQLGEPSSEKFDQTTGIYRPTYATFKQLDADTWEYCGVCFKGKNVAT